MKDATCKNCRQSGQKLFLKGDRCHTPKCPMVKKPYAPGAHGKRRRRISEYGLQLKEKQKMRNIYGLREKQFRNYFKKALQEKGVVGDNLIQKLESRLDNIIFKLGLAESLKKARQIVNHGHVLVNNRKIDIPSYQVKPKDVIKIKKSKINSLLFKDLKTELKKHKTPNWLSFDKNKLEAKILSQPKPEDVNIPVDIHMIVEYYSR